MTGTKKRAGKIPSSVFVLAMLFVVAAALVPGVMAADPVNLGTAANFGVVAKSAITDTSSLSVISGDVALSPTTGAALVGFGTTSCSQVGTHTIYLFDAAGPACAMNNPATAGNAVTDMEAAYSNANSGASDFPTIGGANLGGQTLIPGNYSYTGAVTITGGDVTLDGKGNANAVWIIRTAGALTSDAGRKVILINGAQPDNVFWVVAGYTEIGANTGFNGTILAAGYITLDNSAQLHGRALAQTAVTLEKNTVTVPVLRVAPTASFTFSNATGIAPLTEIFTDTSTADPTAAITRWAWDFEDDGIIDNITRNPVYVYPTAAPYTVNLTVTDSYGAVATKLDTITVYPPPVADFTASPSTGPAYLRVAFTDTSTSSGTITGWAWDFDNDGIIDNTTRNPVNTYNAEGVYTVNLTVTDSLGGVSTKLDTVITVTAPSLEITLVNVPIFLDLNPGAINTNTTSKFYINSTSNWEVRAGDADTINTNGYMTSYSGAVYDPAKKLHNPFMVQDEATDYVLLSSGPVLHTGSPEVSATAYPLDVQQEVTITDPVLPGSDVYHIVVTLTVTSL